MVLHVFQEKEESTVKSQYNVKANKALVWKWCCIGIYPSGNWIRSENENQCIRSFGEKCTISGLKVASEVEPSG